MSTEIDPKDLYRWCSIPVEKLVGHPELRVPFRLVRDAEELGELMANEFVRLIQENNSLNRVTRAIVPCGPKCWYEPFINLVNSQNVSLEKLFVFHMDECLDWEGRPLAVNHPYNFRTFMEKHFYGGVSPELSVPNEQRLWLLPSTMELSLIHISEPTRP